MTINVTKYRLNPDRIFAGTRGSFGMEKLSFDFGDGWDFDTISVTFHPQRGKPIKVPILPGTEIDIPAEVMEHSGESRFVVSGRAVGEDGTIERQAITLEGYVDVAYTADEKGGNTRKVTPDMYDQLIDRASKIFDEAREDVSHLATEAEESASDAEGFANSAEEDASAAEKSASAAKTAEQAASKSAGEAKTAADTATGAASNAAQSADAATSAASAAKASATAAENSRKSVERIAEGIPKTVQNALQEAKDSGEFDGEDGITPHIGENENWYIGNKDTGVRAKGKSGVHVGGDTPPEGTKVWVNPNGKRTKIPKVDETLAKPGYAADAKAVGEKINQLSGEKIDLPKDENGAVNYGVYGSVAISDGNGGIAWKENATEEMAFSYASSTVNITDYTYTKSSVASWQGAVVTGISKLAGGTLEVSWDTPYDGTGNIDIRLCLFKDGAPYMHTGGGDSVNVTGGFSGKLYNPTWYMAGDQSGKSPSHGQMTAPFTVKIPDGCNVMIYIRNTDVGKAFAEWCYSGGIRCMITQYAENGVSIEEVLALINAGTVMVNEQTLSDSQKTQARKNIGAKSDEVNIPKYWENAVLEVETKLNALQSLGGADSFTFGFVTDTHTTSTNSGGFTKLLERVMSTCKIPLLLHGGDFISGVGVSSKSEHLAEIRNHDYIFRDIEHKTLYAMGNHDAVFGQESNYDSSLTDGEVYNYLFRKNEQKLGLVFGEPKTYFYKDIPAQKIRYIVLNCYDYTTFVDDNGKILYGSTKMSDGKIGSEQLMWLADTALDVPDGYSVIICMHAPPFKRSELPEGWSQHVGVITDVDVLRGMLSAYRNRTAYTYSGTFGSGRLEDNYSINTDFSEHKGEVICCIAGHTHMDKIFNLDDGLNIIVTANCSSHVQSIDAPQKTPKTDTEYIMDFVCVNKRTRACNIMRLGAALENDKTCQIISVYNFVDKASEDYRDGHRINASGDIVENAGYAVTNYIPMTLGDIIHVKGFKRISNMFIVAMYNEEKNKIGQAQYTASSASIYAADYDDSVTCFDVSKFSATSSAKYIRISAEIDQTASQIITVNENIEGKTFDGRGFNY